MDEEYWNWIFLQEQDAEAYEKDIDDHREENGNA